MNNYLNKPIVTAGLIASMVSVVSIDTSMMPNSSRYYQCSEYSLGSNKHFSYNRNNFKKTNLQESTSISDEKFGIYDDQNQRYILKNSYDKSISDITNLFGEMTYLSKAGQEEYNSIVNNLFEDTDIQLF
ncbi:hypothetical protein [Paraclostridium tenue]|uniref:Uncharacterized protein n=1 Tax=Paraclostridium tenue TaxID=1737 RepID=A0ABN1M5H6_9FIRM